MGHGCEEEKLSKGPTRIKGEKTYAFSEGSSTWAKRFVPDEPGLGNGEKKLERFTLRITLNIGGQGHQVHQMRATSFQASELSLQSASDRERDGKSAGFSLEGTKRVFSARLNFKVREKKSFITEDRAGIWESWCSQHETTTLLSIKQSTLELAIISPTLSKV